MDRAFGVRSARGVALWIVPGVLMACSFAALAPLALADDPPAGQRAIATCVVAATLLSFVAVWALRYRVVIGEAGIRIKRGLRVIDLGRPKKMRFGQFERDQPLSHRGLLREVTVPITHPWVAVEGANGQHVVFTTSRGMLQRKLDWPYARPPIAGHVFTGDAVALRDAIGERITAG